LRSSLLGATLNRRSSCARDSGCSTPRTMCTQPTVS
jgi:hypothetical protein